ncbi:MAG: ketoacyl-ACP synthase III [Betaproteobacteria bacterium]|nr:ketoacyl-ACP synthase III [Betaproteobacteria bacterium]NBT74403.1 ketoacyl-ACP synthase III [Betaproteobacteria bacterium]NBY14400.1 ketoacyl-ACP synthase III [Betaproteobacteria bacterium]NCA16035.1 ketoacyl-ACP synthase III [Betaproteobacteria bacterium]
MLVNLPYSAILGSGHALPGAPVSNQALVDRLAAQGIETSDAWIRERTGICQRHIAPESVTTSDLASEAGRMALHDAGLHPGDVDLVLVATSTPDMVFPSTACFVQKKLGVHQGAAFDLQAVCSGFVYALATADLFIRMGKAKNALVIGAEIFSRILDWTDRGTCVLFGDGAGAMVLGRSEEPGILAHRLHARGEYENLLRTPGSISHGVTQGHPFLTMDGQAVFKLAVEVLESSAREVLADASLEASDIDWLIPHQANIRILHYTAKRLGLPVEKLVATVDRHGNTSAASVPLAFDLARRDGRLKDGQTVLMQGVGGGFTWGAVLARLIGKRT